jgi:hypothetical protein
MYTSLAKELPNFSGDKASRAQILKKTVDTIVSSPPSFSSLFSFIGQYQRKTALESGRGRS